MFDFDDGTEKEYSYEEKPKMSKFQKIVIAGVSSAVVFWIIVIIMLIPIYNTSTNPPTVISTQETKETHWSQPEPEKTQQLHEQEDPSIPDFPEDITINQNPDVISVGAQLGELWNRGSAGVLNVLVDFNDTVGITEFFRTGFWEVGDALRADSDEEFLEITITRVARNNNVSVIGLEIKGYYTVGIRATCYNEMNAEKFRADLEKLSFVSEAVLTKGGINDEGLFNFELDMIISGE